MIAVETRQEVATRANHLCEYCLSQERFSEGSFSIDHIVPRSAGGSNEPSNLAYSCQGCNNRKYVGVEAIDLVTGRVVGLYNPRIDDWRAHFQWSASQVLIVGITAKGRATEGKLQLNRSGLVNLRWVLVEAGFHPPDIP